MSKRLKLLKEILWDSTKGIRRDFGPTLKYERYEPHILGNKFSKDSEYTNLRWGRYTND